jgi:hypothetical protein
VDLMEGPPPFMIITANWLVLFRADHFRVSVSAANDRGGNWQCAWPAVTCDGIEWGWPSRHPVLRRNWPLWGRDR